MAIGNLSDEFKNTLLDTASKLESSLEEAIFAEGFFDTLNFNGYKSWFDLGNTAQLHGLLDSYQSFLEIRINGRKQVKILSADLYNENLLFPLYSASIKHLEVSEKANLIIVEKEIGNIASFTFDIPKFSISELQFALNFVSPRPDLKYKILTNISYSGKELKSKKTDALIKERFALLL